MSGLEVGGYGPAYGAARVLHGADPAAGEREIVLVLGPNGAGKTTLLRAPPGLVAARGAVKVGGVSVLGLAPEEIVRRGLGHVTEERGVFGPLTVEENLRVGRSRGRGRAGGSTTTWRACSPTSPFSRPTSGSPPGPSAAASRGCSPSAGRSWGGPGCCCSTSPRAAFPRADRAAVPDPRGHRRARGRRRSSSPSRTPAPPPWSPTACTPSTPGRLVA